MHQIQFRTPVGSLQRSSSPIATFKGRTSQGTRRKGREWWEGGSTFFCGFTLMLMGDNFYWKLEGRRSE